MERYVHKPGCEWLFNPPHASHFRGAWEQQIGTIRCVLDAMFAELGCAQLTHELLVTLMAKVTAIVNARPIALVPTDVYEPQPLSPSMLLTMKARRPPSWHTARSLCLNRPVCPPPVEESSIPCRPILATMETRILAKHAAQKKMVITQTKLDQWRRGSDERG